MNILFTSVGRRVELIQAFREAADSIECLLKVHGADISDTAPALQFCDSIHMVPRINDINYIPALLNICEKERIDALVPTIDTDLYLLSQNKEKFSDIGTKVFISEPDKIAICRDKNLTEKFFNSCGLKAPQTFNDVPKYNKGYPAFIKPKDGSSSINAFKVNTREELVAYAAQISNYIIQPFVEGTEYTVDAFCDFEGNPIYITPRIRMAVRAGEVLKTQIVHDEKINAEICSLIKEFKPCGAITVQLIREESTGDDYYIEINPRFGGGAPLSMKAGANSAKTMLQILNGEKSSFCPNVAEAGAIYSRFEQSVRVK